MTQAYCRKILPLTNRWTDKQIDFWLTQTYRQILYKSHTNTNLAPYTSLNFRMTSSIQPLSSHRFSDSAYVMYNHQNSRQTQAYPEYNSRARNDVRAEHGKDYRDKPRHNDMYAVPQRTFSDSTAHREK